MYVNTVVLHGWRDQVIMKWSRNCEEESVIEKYFDVVNVTDLEDAALQDVRYRMDLDF